MPICGYVVYPVSGKADELRRMLGAMPECAVRVSDQKNVLVMVTDTPDDQREKELQEKLNAIPAIQCLAMTFAHLESGSL